jgi:hypothetical protein
MVAFSAWGDILDAFSFKAFKGMGNLQMLIIGQICQGEEEEFFFILDTLLAWNMAVGDRTMNLDPASHPVLAS